jgi:hypothetical protein
MISALKVRQRRALHSVAMSEASDSTPGPAASHPFDADTAVEPSGDGVFDATVSDRWNRLLGGPLGGYLLAICLQALRRTVPFPDPVVVSAFFLRPARVGASKVQTALVRAGRRMASGEARLLQDGKECLGVLATFTDLAQVSGRTVVFNAPPDLPPADQALDPLEGRSVEGATIAERVELRTPGLPGWLRGEPTGRPAAEL